MRNLRTSRRLAWIGVPVALLIALVAFWNWDWFIPIVQSRASAAIGRPVTIAHLHLHLRLGRVVTVTADGVVVANPPDWPNGDPPFVSIKSLTIQADAWGYVRGNGLVVPVIEIDGPRVLAAETKDGAANFRLSTGGGGGGSLKIGAVQIIDGDAHVVIPPLKSDFNAKIETQGDGDAAKLVVDAKGTYAAQPITARLVGGAFCCPCAMPKILGRWS
jgi:AsmA family protein